MSHKRLREKLEDYFKHQELEVQIDENNERMNVHTRFDHQNINDIVLDINIYYGEPEHTLFIDFILEHVDKNIRVFNLINDYNKEMFGFKAYIDDDGDLMISYSDWVTDDDIIEVIDYIMDEFLGVESIEIIEEIPELMQI